MGQGQRVHRVHVWISEDEHVRSARDATDTEHAVWSRAVLGQVGVVMHDRP